eukprot:4650199-Prymnesium_polylepis.2
MLQMGWQAGMHNMLEGMKKHLPTCQPQPPSDRMSQYSRILPRARIGVEGGRLGKNRVCIRPRARPSLRIARWEPGGLMDRDYPCGEADATCSPDGSGDRGKRPTWPRRFESPS